MNESENRPIIQVRDLIKTYGLLPVLRKINLNIAHGQFVALLGPNGSGKSTLLRLMSGLSKPTSGAIFIGGWELPQEADVVRGKIGMVSHKPLLYENLTAQENLIFFARLYNIPKKRYMERIEELLKRVGLKRRANDPVRTFSRGMQQRLSIARALIHNPDVLLFDEPYTGLDQDAAAVLDTILVEAHQEGRTIIMSTHQLDRAARLCSHVVILARGQIGHDAPNVERDTLALATLYTETAGMVSAR